VALSINAAAIDWDSAGQTTLISSSSDLSSNTLSAASSTLDNSTTKATTAKLVLSAKDGFAGTWSARPTLSVYMQELDIDGTNDARPPTSNFYQRLVGTFYADSGAGTSAQYMTTLIDMFGVRSCALYIRNQTGRTMTGTTNGWTLKAELLSVAPYA
jgi:hypothetical protein